MKEMKYRKKMKRSGGWAILMVAQAAALAMGRAEVGKAEEGGGSLTVYLSQFQAEYYGEGIQEFRELYPEVNLELAAYSMTEPLSSSEKVKTELMAGKGPDLLLFSSLGLDDVHKLLAAGAFAPLDEFMTPERGWEAEDYVETVIEGGRFDGTQYVIPLNYRIPLVLASEEGLQEIGFDTAACRDTVSFLQETASLYGKEYSDQILAEPGCFSIFPQQLNGDFLDYKGGELGVNREELRAACEAYRQIFEEDTYGADYLDLSWYGKGTALLERKAYLDGESGIDMLLQNAVAVAGAETPVMLPFLSEEGTTAAISEYAGIRATSENKENAWRLLQILLGEKMQRQAAFGTPYIPVRKSVVEEDIWDKLDEIIESGKTEMTVGDPGQEFVEEYLNYLTAPGRAVFFSSLAREFIVTMIPYFEGEEEYEECLEEFENYARIYLTE